MIDKDKAYGLVFEGGGAKGAYQIGVWKALEECGVKICAVAGVSVGALNGALVAMGDLERAESIWREISYSKVMEVDDLEMDQLIERALKHMNILNVTRKSVGIVASGGFNITPLRKLIETHIDEKKIKESDVDLYLTTVNLTDLKEVDICVKELEDGKLANYLIASASLPVFKREKLEGKSFLDGGVLNNVPVDLLINHGYKNIIVVRIYGIGKEKRVRVPENVNIIEIAPRVPLGSIMEFKKSKTLRNMRIGYYDTLRVVKDLSGKIYYIDIKEEDSWFFNQFLEMNEEVVQQCLKYYKEYEVDPSLHHRKIFEVICPSLANELGLDKNWTYRELYVSMAEACAKAIRIKKYLVYTFEQFLTEINNGYSRKEWKELKKDKFIRVMMLILMNKNLDFDELVYDEET